MRKFIRDTAELCFEAKQVAVRLLANNSNTDNIWLFSDGTLHNQIKAVEFRDVSLAATVPVDSTNQAPIQMILQV